ncbi:MAG TPA: MFS transporter [Chloroflexota bacterium]
MHSIKPGSEFQKLWAATAISNLGDGVILVATPLLAAEFTHDPALVAGVSLARHVPWLLFALVSGVLADRFDRRRAMALAACVRGVLVGTLALATIVHTGSLPLLYGVVFLISTGETLFDITATTLVPAVVAPERMPRAYAQLAGARTVANLFVGPPLGGLLFGVSPALAFGLGAMSLLLAGGLVLRLRGVGCAPVERTRHLTADSVEGVRWLWQHRLLRTISLTSAPLNMTLVAQNSIIVLFAQQRLGLDAAGFGALVSVYGFGGIVGSLVAERAVAWLGMSRGLRLAVLIETAYPAAFVLSSTPLQAGMVFALFGVHAVVFGALTSALQQELTPPALRGRIESAARFIEHGSTAPGALLGGVVASNVGLGAPFWLGTATGLVLIPLVWHTFSARVIDEARRDALTR